MSLSYSEILFLINSGKKNWHSFLSDLCLEISMLNLLPLLVLLGFRTKFLLCASYFSHLNKMCSTVSYFKQLHRPVACLPILFCVSKSHSSLFLHFRVFIFFITKRLFGTTDAVKAFLTLFCCWFLGFFVLFSQRFAVGCDSSSILLNPSEGWMQSQRNVSNLKGNFYT